MNARDHHAEAAAERSVWLNSEATAHEQLGLLPNHTEEERKKAVRDAFKRWHPDMPSGSKDVFICVQRAKTIINDTLSRDADAQRFAERHTERQREHERRTEGEVATRRHEQEDQMRAAGIYGGGHVKVKHSRLNAPTRQIAPWIVPAMTVLLISAAGAFVATRPRAVPPCATAQGPEMARALNVRDNLQETLEVSETAASALMTRLNSPGNRTAAQNDALLRQAREAFAQRDAQRRKLDIAERTILTLNCQSQTEPRQ